MRSAVPPAIAFGVSRTAWSKCVAPSAVASASITNAAGGAINIVADANASNAAGSAQATAIVLGGIEQLAAGATSANALIDNAGAINVVAMATAVAPDVFVLGHSSSQHAVWPVASASALVGVGISQVASAHGGTVTATLTGAPGTTTVNFGYAGSANANASIANSGTINVMAGAIATGADAIANAVVGTGIFQTASADGAATGVANATIANAAGGAINIDAVASANGSTNASANATVTYGVSQNANAYGVSAAANAALTNDGTISVIASANANASGSYLFGTAAVGDASANAYIESGIFQDAFASGHRTASIVFTTAGPGTAFAYEGTAVASAALDNTGSIVIAANAAANGSGDAFANATIDWGISQNAYAFAASAATADASIVNSGTINIAANANATAGSFATASAYIETGLVQEANGMQRPGPPTPMPASTIAEPFASSLRPRRAEARHGALRASKTTASTSRPTHCRPLWHRRRWSDRGLGFGHARQQRHHRRRRQRECQCQRQHCLCLCQHRRRHRAVRSWR